MDEILIDIHSLEEDLIRFEKKYGILSETFYSAYIAGEEPENDDWMLDFSEWAGVYQTWLKRNAQYRLEVQKLRKNNFSIKGLIRVTT